jgi:trigger factor
VLRSQQSGEDPQEFMKHMVEHNHIPEMVQEIRRGKALARIVESATVTDGSGNVVELKNLRPDGTIGEPVDETGNETGSETVDEAAAEQAPVDEPSTPAARL